MAKQFTLGRRERLKSQKLIGQLFTEGKNFHLAPYRVYYLVQPSDRLRNSSPVRFGVGVSGKNFKKAVHRNRVKRLTREAFRLNRVELNGKLKEKQLQLNLFLIYNSKELPEFNTTKEKLGLILVKLTNLVDENLSSNT